MPRSNGALSISSSNSSSSGSKCPSKQLQHSSTWELCRAAPSREHLGNALAVSATVVVLQQIHNSRCLRSQRASRRCPTKQLLAQARGSQLLAQLLAGAHRWMQAAAVHTTQQQRLYLCLGRLQHLLRLLAL